MVSIKKNVNVTWDNWSGEIVLTVKKKTEKDI